MRIALTLAAALCVQTVPALRADDSVAVQAAAATADYTASQAWARAIHDASPRWDGIRYVSRQMNKGFAYAIFERSGLRKLRAEKLKARQVDDLCDRFNVTAV